MTKNLSEGPIDVTLTDQVTVAIAGELKETLRGQIPIGFNDKSHLPT